MGAGVFVVEELRAGGNEGPLSTALSDSGGERFEWYSDRRPKSAKGGARSVPAGVMGIGGKLNRARTDYPGTSVPSEQVISPVRKDMTFDGVWDDRYNFHGFAVAEMRRFEEMCHRANRVRVSFQAQAFEGLIVEWDFPYRGDWEVHYHFAFSVHVRIDDPALNLRALAGAVGRDYGLGRSPANVATPEEVFAGVDLGVQAALQAHTDVPRGQLSGTLADDVEDKLATLAAGRDAVNATIDRSPVTQATKAAQQFSRVGTQLRDVRDGAAAAVARLSAVRSDTELGFQSAVGVMQFEDWSRSLRYFGRLVVGDSDRGARQVEQRAKPPTLRTYRPQKGENVYAIANRFYGSPRAWPTIAEANDLGGVTFDGTELLVIPERGAG